jgi:hypothetical protein
MAQYKPYSIFTPPFETTSGGIRCMWGLFGWLLAKGQIAQVNTTFDIPFVGIYPEIAQGNPLNAQTVVRYILQKPGLATMYGVPGPKSFEPTDKLYYFSKIYAPPDVKEEQLMFLPIVNLHIFKDQKKERTKTCYLVGKGLNTNVHPKDSILIDRTFANDQQALADLLNECHTMYSYDPVTAQMEIARLCGCKVIVIPNEQFIVDLKDYEPGLNGISFWPDVTKVLDVEEFRYHYKDMIQIFSEKLDNFIIATQQG